MCYPIVKKEGDIMPKFHKIKLALAFLSLFALISMVQKTYTKYNTSAFGDASMSIARWQIVVNNQDVVQNAFITNVISPTIISNEHVKEGVMAPRAVGYFDLFLNYTNVDTSFDLTVVSSIPNDAGVTDLKVTGYSEDGGAIVPLDGELTNFVRRILLSDSLRTKTIRVYITWEDSETESMDNAADTDASLTNKKAVLHVLLNFKQVTD